MGKSIAALLTCHNRREKTVRLLTSLLNTVDEIDIYLVDDGSTDGTSESVKTIFPCVNIITGNGSLYWNRGMHLAWDYAKKNDYDFYLWLNDDVVLYEYFLNELFKCVELSGFTAIVSGIIENLDNGEILYGGYDNKKRLIKPCGEMQEITFLNGNVVLIPKSIFQILGNLDPVFHHDLGDVDYGLRAREMNIKVLSTRVSVGACEVNKISRVRQSGFTLVDRFRRLYSPLGSNPNITFYFKKKHYGLIKASMYYIFILLLNILPDNFVRFIFGKKYD